MKERRDYELEIKLSQIAWTDVFTKSYKIALRNEFVENKNLNEHTLTNHVNGLVQQLTMNNKPLIKLDYPKRTICAVNFNSSVGSEIIGLRPAIIYKSNSYLTWEDVIVIPLTSAAKQKLVDGLDVLITKDFDNKLYQNSYARIRQLKAVSYKRIGKQVGIIQDKKVQAAIEASIVKMLGLHE